MLDIFILLSKNLKPNGNQLVAKIKHTNNHLKLKYGKTIEPCVMDKIMKLLSHVQNIIDSNTNDIGNNNSNSVCSNNSNSNNNSNKNDNDNENKTNHQDCEIFHTTSANATLNTSSTKTLAMIADVQYKVIHCNLNQKQEQEIEII